MVGHLLLGYPRTWDSLAWGAMIGVAAALATLVAGEAARRTGSIMTGLILALLAAFVVYELTLFAATAALPSGAGAFSPAVIGQIFLVNVLALAGLATLHSLAVAIGLLASARPMPLPGQSV